MEHPHRETKYRPGPNPHWPVCHQIGPRFIHVCHLICSSGNFIYSHIRWDFILGLTTGQSTQPLIRGADIQTSATGGDVADRTSIQSRRVSTVTESLPVEDTTEQFSADEEEELGDDPLHCEDPVMHISGAGHWFLEGWIGDQPGGGNGRDHWDGCVRIGVATYARHQEWIVIYTGWGVATATPAGFGPVGSRVHDGSFVNTAIFGGCPTLLCPDHWWSRTAI